MRGGWCALPVLISILGMTACGDSATQPALRTPGIHVAEGAVLDDTVLSVHELTVVATDTSLAPASGRLLRLAVEMVPSNFFQGSEYPLGVAVGDSDLVRSSAIARTDDRGRVTLHVHLLYHAGPAALVLSAPELGYVDTAWYTIRPGAAAGVTLAPADTAVYAARQVALRAHTVDQFHNARPDSITFTVASGPVTVDAATALLTTGAIGRAAVVAQSGAYRDTAYVSVVPQAWVAAQAFNPGNGGATGLFLMQLDGSGRTPFRPGLATGGAPTAFGWSPDGQWLAFARGHYLTLLAPGGMETPLVEMSGDLLSAVRYSRDGTWIYFAQGGMAAQPQGLWRVHTDGSGLEHIGQVGLDYGPAPSHDGQSVAYVSYRTPCGIAPCIRVLDLATNTDRMFGSQDYLVQGAAVSWSPTEDLIAYQSGSHLMLARSDGTGSRVLGDLLAGVDWIDWSPDGQWLVVAEVGVTLYNVQTGLRLPIAQMLAYDATAWRP